MKAKSIASVEITDTHIKLVQATAGHAPSVIIHADARPIIQKSDEEISKLLSAMIATAKIKTDPFIAAVPRRLIILRNISLPAHADQEIEKMVHLQVSQQIPYPKEDVILDYNVLSKESSGYSKVLVIAVHKEVVNRYLKIFAASGLPLHKLTVSSDGLLGWHLFREQRLRVKKSLPTAVINVDATDTEICFCHRQKLTFARSIHFGSKDLTQENIKAFIEQIGLTMMTYTKEEIGEDIEKIVVISNAPSATDVKEKLSEEYRVHVETADPFEQMATKRHFHLPLIFTEDGLSSAVNLGLVLFGQKKLMNLLPAEVASSRELKKRKREWIKFLILFFLAFFLSVGVFGVQLYENKVYLQELESALEQREPLVKSVQEKMKRTALIQERLKPGFSVMDIISALYRFTPPDVSYSQIAISDDGSMTLQGVAEASASVNTLQNNLVASALFENVTLQYVTKRRVYKGELTDFKIACKLNRLTK
ncbi:MAG: pilus assembly protein PilM [Candidatus Omnitrophota bacterium]